MSLLNYWHYITLGFIFLIFLGGVISSFKEENSKIFFPMLISVTVISLLLAVFSVFIVDKYTKEVELYRLENHRLLSIEKIVYTGVVKNEGNHAIGKVTFEIKLVNKGHATGNVKSGSFFKPSGFLDFFTGGSDVLYQPQTITKKFVVAKNLRPGDAKAFRVHFDYPPYFRNVSQFSSVSGH
jgi:uncharacterized membrane protein YsdA (DUF1294 family)